MYWSVVKDGEINGERALRGVQLKDEKRTEDLMLVLNETVDQLVMANSVRWYGDVLRWEDGHVFGRA